MRVNRSSLRGMSAANMVPGRDDWEGQLGRYACWNGGTERLRGWLWNQYAFEGRGLSGAETSRGLEIAGPGYLGLS